MSPTYPLITRRQTLQSLATATVFASGLGGMVLSLAGCGGSGGDSPSTPGGTGLRATPVTATVTLPAGAGAPAPGALKVWTSGGTRVPKANGQVRVTVMNDGPQFAEARDAQGRPVVLGFLGKGRTDLNAESTAELLGFFAIGGGFQRDEAARVYLSGVKGLPGFELVKDAVTAQIAARGHVSVGESPLKEALLGLKASLPSGGGAAPATRGTIADPTSAGGLSLDTTTDGEIKLQNVWLRRGYAFLDEVSHEDAKGNLIEFRNAGPEFWIDLPGRYAGIVGTIGDYVQGKVAYSPVDQGPFPVPNPTSGHPDSRTTTYALTVVGAGGSGGDFAKLTPNQVRKQKDVVYYTVFVDLILSTIANLMIPLGSADVLDDITKVALTSGAVGDFINLARDTTPAVYALAQEGKFDEAFFTFLNAVETTGTVWQVAAAVIADAFSGRRGFEDLTVEKLGKRFDDVFDALGYIDVGFNLIDLGVFGVDNGRSNQADVFAITSTAGKVTLAATRPLLPANETTNVRATIQNRNPDAAYKYQWSVNAGFRIDDPFGKNTDNSPGGVLTTSQELVLVLAKDLKPGLAKVTCKVIRIDGTTDSPLAVTTGDILFTGKATLGASQIKVDKGGASVLTATYDGPEETEWVYSLNPATAGTLSVAGRTTSKTVTFTAGQTAGAVQIRAECFVKVEGEFYSLGTTGAVVNVDTTTTTSGVGATNVSGVLVAPPGSGPLSNGYGTLYYGCAARVVAVTPIPGATRYEVFRDGQIVKSWTPSNPPGPPIAQQVEIGWWEEFKPEGTYWARIDFRRVGNSFEYDAGEAAKNASDAAASLEKSHGDETYTLRVTY